MDIDENQFKLYFRMAKNYAFNLPDEKDRIKASKWIRKIEGTTDASAKRTKFHVIQLLLLSLQRKELVGPFEKLPKDDTELTSYKWTFQPSDIARLILRKEFDRIGQPEVHVQMSGDLCEFVAYQEIPNFGTHFFYAFSPEHIQKWTNLDKDIIPKGLLNITVLSSPDTSILRKSVMETLSKRGQAENSDKYNQIREELKTSLYTTAIDKTCVLSEAEEQFEDCLMETAPENSRYIDPAENNRISQAPPVGLSIELQDDGLTSKKRAMPARLRERLTRKFVPKQQRQYPDRDPNLARTPEIFRKDAHKIKHFRKYKPEEFHLTKNEKFRPSHEAFRNLEYMPPENARRSPGKKYLQRPFQPEQDKTPGQNLDIEQVVEDSFERSFKRMQEERHQRRLSDRNQPVKKNELIERLDHLKSNQAKRIVFDDMDVDIETEEIAFDRFVYKELPEDDENVTVLDNTEMLYEDIFGEDQICDVDVLTSPRPIRELEQAEILLDTEMQLDDIFGEEQIANPEAVFKDVSIEGERVVMPNSGCAQRGSYRIGKRIMALPGQEPSVQTYVEQIGNDQLFNESLLRNEDNTPPLEDSMINKVLGDKLKTYIRGENVVPRTYGPWATRFSTDIEKLERGEELEVEEPQNISYLSDTELETDDLFEERHITVQGGIPSPIIQERSRKATKQFDSIKTQYARTKSRRQKEAIDQDLLEPYIYEPVLPDKKGLLDNSIECDDQLAPPLLQKISVRSDDPFETFEKQLDESLQFFKEDSTQFTDTSQGQNVYWDSDFLNKRIEGDLPADNSIIGDDEMILDEFSGIDEYIPVKDIQKQNEDGSYVHPNTTSEMEEMLDNLSSPSSDVLDPSEILPSAAGRSPGQRLRQTLDIVNKYRLKRGQKLPPSHEIPYTQLADESFPLSSDSESADNAAKSDVNLWNTGKMNEMEKRLDTLRIETASTSPSQRIPLTPIELDTPTRKVIQKSQQASADVHRLRNRYKTLQEEQLNKQDQRRYSGSFQHPLPVLNKSVPSEIEDIDDLFDISEKDESGDICDVSQKYDPVLKQYIPAQRLEDVSIPEADFIGDELLQPQKTIYHSCNLPEKGKSEPASDTPMLQPEPCMETPHNAGAFAARRRLSYGQQTQRQQRQRQQQPEPCPEPEPSVSGSRGKRKLIYEMHSPSEFQNVPLNVSPRERIKLLIEQQPNVEVTAHRGKSEFSPMKFTSKHVAKQPYELEQETFPDECPPANMYEDLGDLAHALYIPTAAEEREIENFHKSQRQVCTPPRMQRISPQQRQQRSNVQDVSPIGRTDVLPDERGFKWLPNYVPLQQQVGADRSSRRPQREEICPPQPQSRGRKPQSRQPQSQLQAIQSKVPESKPPQSKPGLSRGTQSKPSQSRVTQSRATQSRPSQSRPPQSRPPPSGPSASGAPASGPPASGPPNSKPTTSQSRLQSRPSQSKVSQSRATQPIPSQSRPPQSKPPQSKPPPSRPTIPQSKPSQPQSEQPQCSNVKPQSRPAEPNQQQYPTTNQKQGQQQTTSQRQGPQQQQREMPKRTASSKSVNQQKYPERGKITQRKGRQIGSAQSSTVSLNKNQKVPTTAKVEIFSDKQKDKEILMRTSETVTKKPQPPKATFEPKKKKKITCTKSGTIVGQPQTSTQTRKLTTGAVGEYGRSLVEKSNVTVTKDYGKKSQKTVKSSQIKYNNDKEQRTREYTFASKK